MFQVLSGLAKLHSEGGCHGRLTPDQVLLTEALWVWISGAQGLPLAPPTDPGPPLSSPVAACGSGPGSEAGQGVSLGEGGDFSQGVGTSQRVGPSQRVQGARSLGELLEAWRCGRVSNYDYLMGLNRLAGRRWEDIGFHPVLPWVLDMSQPPEPGMEDTSQVIYLPVWMKSFCEVPERSLIFS